MGFFDKLKLVNKKSGYTVRYNGETLLVIKPKVLKTLVLDHISKAVKAEIIAHSNPSMMKRKSNTTAIKLLTLYNKMKCDYHDNPRIRKITIKDKEFSFFIQAASVIEDHKVSPQEFMDAQVEGLKFINNGAGSFPKPNQLVTLNAEDRLISKQRVTSSTESGTNFVRLELTKADRETDLMDNPRFTSRYAKVEEKKATLQDTYFVYDCMLHRKGRVTTMVDDYLDGLLDKANG